MSSTQVIFKPGGVVALVLLSAVIVAAGIVGLRARTTYKASETATGAMPVAAVSTPIVAAGAPMSGPEIQERDFLASLNAAPGQKRDWLFLGPLPSGITITNVNNTADDEAKMRQIIATSYLPTEAKYQAQEDVPVKLGNATYRWRKVTGSAFDFKDMYASKDTPRESMENTVIYGYANIESKGTTRKRLRFRSDDGAIVWVNGRKVYLGNKIRGVDTEDIIPVELRPGRNNVLVKVGQGTGGWGMSFHLEDAP